MSWAAKLHEAVSPNGSPDCKSLKEGKNMTENQKRRLNATVIEFVNRESQRRDWAVTAEEIADAYSVAHSTLIRESGATLEQVLRMVVYTLEIGYPQDLFLVCEFDADRYRAERVADSGFRLEVLEEGDPLLSLRLPDIDRIIASLDLSTEERNAVCDRMTLMKELMEPFVRGVTPKPSAGQAMRMLAARYDNAVASHVDREPWMDDMESLIAAACLVQPELDTLGALRAVMPRRVRVMKK
jgi:hypothetical protein